MAASFVAEFHSVVARFDIKVLIRCNHFLQLRFMFYTTWQQPLFSISVQCCNCCSCVLFCRVVVLESRPTDNPTALSNLYILAGHENSYWFSATETGQVLEKWIRCLSYGRKKKQPQTHPKVQCHEKTCGLKTVIWEPLFLIMGLTDRSVKADPLQTGFMSSLTTPATAAARSP